MPYVSVEELRQYTEAHEEDSTLQRYVSSAENIVNTYLGYSPALYTYTHYFDGAGTGELQLKARPIAAVTSVEIDGEAEPLSGFYTAGESEFLYSKGIFPAGRRNVKVEYDAGYGITPGDDQANSVYVPEVIRLTVLRIAALLQTESGGNIGVTSKSFADSGTRTFVNTVNFDKYLVQLSSYKLLVI
jgi:hypothetical protein